MCAAALQSLNLSSCNLQGQLPEALADLANLRQLNLSSNPALAGSLPALWAAMPHMQLLDVSGCALNGSLPAEFAAWQELRVLRAAGNRALGGQLPGSWGLMQSLQVRLTVPGLIYVVERTLLQLWHISSALQINSNMCQRQAVPGGSLPSSIQTNITLL